MATIAVVDDHSVVRSGITTLLEAQGGWEITYAGDSISPLLDRRIDAEFCLLDINLNGRAVSPEEVAELTTLGIHVLIVTALDSPRHARSLALAGASGVIAKSEPDSVILDALTRLRAGEEPLAGLLSVIATFDDQSPDLTKRELDVLELYTAGMTIHSVARKLGLSEHTVKYYLREIRRKFTSLGYPSTTALDLARSANQAGLVEW